VPPDSLNDDIFLGPDDDAPPKRGEKSPSTSRLRPLPGAYVRVPIQWLTRPCREHVFRAEERLFLYVLYRSHWGQHGVKLTNAVAAEIGLSKWTKLRALQKLEQRGWLRAERQTAHSAPTVWPIVLAG